MAAPLYNLRAFQAAFWLARLTPRALTQRLAPPIARWAARRRSEGRMASKESLRHVTGLTGRWLEKLSWANINNFSRMLADYFYYSSREPRAAKALMESWSGYDYLSAAREAGKGVLLIAGHIGNWELGGVLLAHRGFVMNVITLDEPTTALTAWRDAFRRRLGIKTIAVGPGRDFAFLEMMQALRRGECLAMLVDRPYAGTGTPVQLFGRETEFSSAPALLWQHTGAAVIPAFVTRSRGGRYQAQALPPVAMKSVADGGSIAENTQTIATTFESVIRRFPEQWYNYTPVWPSKNGS